MGKAMIIRGANFAPMRIESGFEKIDYIGLSDRNGAETGIGRYIYSGINSSADVRMSITFRTVEKDENSSYNNVIIAGSRYSISSIMQVCLNRKDNENDEDSDNVVVSFGSYGTFAENKEIINKDLWDGEEHTIDFCKDFIKIDDDTYNWTHTNINVGNWGGPIYLDCASCPPEDGYNTYISADQARKTIITNDNGDAVRRTLFDADCIKLKEIKIWEDYSSEASLAIDAIPVIRKKDSVVCFYNKVNGAYLVRNDGSTPSHPKLNSI